MFHDADAGTPYVPISLGANGGVVPYTWSSSGPFPPGLAVSPGGDVSGTPTSPASYSFSVRVTDAAGRSATTPATIIINPALSFAGGAVPICPSGVGCSATFPYTGGSSTTVAVTGFTFSETCFKTPCSSDPPPIPTVFLIGGSVTVSVPPLTSCNWGRGYSGSITVMLSDSSPCSVSANCSVTATVSVGAQPPGC